MKNKSRFHFSSGKSFISFANLKDCNQINLTLRLTTHWQQHTLFVGLIGNYIVQVSVSWGVWGHVCVHITRGTSRTRLSVLKSDWWTLRRQAAARVLVVSLTVGWPDDVGGRCVSSGQVTAYDCVSESHFGTLISIENVSASFRSGLFKWMSKYHQS